MEKNSKNQLEKNYYINNKRKIVDFLIGVLILLIFGLIYVAFLWIMQFFPVWLIELFGVLSLFFIVILPIFLLFRIIKSGRKFIGWGFLSVIIVLSMYALLAFGSCLMSFNSIGK